jgi:hypothetical protein
MSNEYKDWYIEKLAEEKELVARYPFLQARNLDGSIDEDSDFPMMGLEIPNGWYKLFYQMCDDIKDLVPEDFYFLQVKEKHNFMRCYTANSTSEVDAIISKYENMAPYICTVCGNPATFETSGYIASFCDGCWKDFARHEKGKLINFRPYYHISYATANGFKDEQISFEEAWNRYMNYYTQEGIV